MSKQNINKQLVSNKVKLFIQINKIVKILKKPNKRLFKNKLSKNKMYFIF